MAACNKLLQTAKMTHTLFYGSLRSIGSHLTDLILMGGLGCISEGLGRNAFTCVLHGLETAHIPWLLTSFPASP